MPFWIACIGLAIVGLPDGSLGVAWPSLRATLALPQAALGLILVSLASGTFCAGLISGRWLAAQGPRRVLTCATLLAVAALCVIALAPVTPVLCSGALLLGLGQGSIDAAVNAAAAFTLSARRMNWIHGCYGIGAMLGPLAMTGIIVQAGLSWRLGYGGLAAAFLCAAAVFARRVPATIAHHADTHPGVTTAASAVRHRLVWLLIAVFCVYCGIEVMLGQWSYTILTAGRGVPDGTAGLCVGAYWGSLALGRFLLGMAIQRVGADRLLRAATFAIIAGTLCIAVAPGLWAALGLVIAGLAAAPVFPTLMARAPDRLGAAIALHAIGFAISAAMLGGAVLPALGGWLADSVGVGAIPWCALAAACVLLVLHEALLAAAPPVRSVAREPQRTESLARQSPGATGR